DELPVDRVTIPGALRELLQAFLRVLDRLLQLEPRQLANASRQRLVVEVVEADDFPDSREVERPLDPRPAVRVVRVAERVVRRIDPGVDDGPDDVAAVDGEERLRGVGLDGSHGSGERRTCLTVERDRPYETCVGRR